jgi:hypothetical protein
MRGSVQGRMTRGSVHGENEEGQYKGRMIRGSVQGESDKSPGG